VISSKVGHSLDPAALWVYRLLFRDKVIHPNRLTIIGALFGAASCVAIALDRLIIAAILLFLAGLFDVMDGAVARTMGSMTPFGGFLDSVLDRYTDLLITLGVLIHFLKRGDALLASITFVSAIGIAVIPYAKARAEAASFGCNSGLLERPERIILLFIGLLFNVLPPVITLLAIFTHVTVVQRILYVRRQATKKQ
jgi:CDP-diacylglycerol---glycerol-3-phosphate 3-phosphatidyltransferase